MTGPYAEVIGDPIKHSLSPLLHEFWLRQVGIGGHFTATEVRPPELAEYLETRRRDPAWRGCSVTIPHKESVVPLLDQVSTDAVEIGAVNCIYRCADQLHGRNTDVAGIAAALEGVSIAGEAATVIGGGGAARAAIRYLASAGCACIRLIVREPAKASVLRALAPDRLKICAFHDVGSALGGMKLVINATPLGMDRFPPMPTLVLDTIGELDPGATVFDMVYPRETPLLSAARSRGARAVGGLPMLVGQARAAFELFFGTRAPSGPDALPEPLLASLRASR